jgi:antibiotic biosynthesis monooxygenase (ABM) superfamily enzyme
MQQPPRWKMAVLIWIAIYPTLTLLLFLIGDYINQISFLPFRTLALTLIIVPLMVFVLLPTLSKLLHRWLHG